MIHNAAAAALLCSMTIITRHYFPPHDPSVDPADLRRLHPMPFLLARS